ncbi:hypothetical protein ACFVOK_38575 [Streptomyces sp. NPDC057798]
MRASDGWDTVAYKGLDGTPIWLLIVIIVLVAAWIAAVRIRRNR